MSSRLPRTVLLLGLTSFFTDVAGEMTFPLLPAFLASLGAGPALLGLIEGAADALAAALKYQAGAMADRAPAKKPMVLLGYGLAGLVRPLFALATLPWHVLTVRLLDRVGKGVRSAPRDALISQSVDDAQAGRAFGFHRAMDHAGAVVGPLTATGLLLWGFAPRTVFASTIVPGVLAVAMVLLVREAAGAPTPPRAAAPSAPLPPELKRFLTVLAVFSLGNSSDAFLLVRAKELGLGVELMPLLWAFLHVSKMSWTWLGGRWADRFPRLRLLWVGWAVYALVYLGLALATQAWQVWALFAVYGAFYGLSEPVEKALVKSLTPKDAQGRAFGAYHAVLGASAIPAGLLTGGLWQLLGPAAALLTGAGLSLVAAALLAWWRVPSAAVRQ